MISESFAESEISFIQVQTTLRDSSGNLIAYLESSKFTDLNYDALGPFLDFEASLRDDPVYTVGEQKFQLIKRVVKIPVQKENMIASTLLVDNKDGKEVLLARFAHDGYVVVPGDVVTSTWTFVRTL